MSKNGEMMGMIYSILTAAGIAALGVYLSMPQERERRGTWVPKDKKRERFLLWIYLAVMAAAIEAYALYCAAASGGSAIWTRDVRMLWFLLLLAAAAWQDAKYHLIFNHLLIAGLAGHLALCLPGLLLDTGQFFADLRSGCAAALIFFVFLMLMRVISSNGIGFGDIKLILLLAFSFGMNTVFAMIFFSLLAVFFYAVLMLILRKKGKKDEVAFAPAVLAGVYLTGWML